MLPWLTLPSTANIHIDATFTSADEPDIKTIYLNILQRMKYLSTPPPVKVVVVVVAMKCDIYTSHNEIMDAAREDCHTTTTTTTTTTTDHKLTIQ